jgi:phage tail-like protein
LMNEAHRDVMRWNFENAWINKIEGPAMNATGNQVAIETMELVHEGLTMEVESSAA